MNETDIGAAIEPAPVVEPTRGLLEERIGISEDNATLILRGSDGSAYHFGPLDLVARARIVGLLSRSLTAGERAGFAAGIVKESHVVIPLDQWNEAGAAREGMIASFQALHEYVLEIGPLLSGEKAALALVHLQRKSHAIDLARARGELGSAAPKTPPAASASIEGIPRIHLVVSQEPAPPAPDVP